MNEDVERLQSELAQVEERLQTFIDSDAEVIFCYEPLEEISATLPAHEQAQAFMNSKLVACNNLFARSRGASTPKELVGKHMSVLAQESSQRILALIEELIVKGTRPEGYEVVQQRPDGSKRYAMARGHIVVQGGKLQRLWVMLRDVTEQKRAQAEREALQARLRQAQRMESVGMLAGGVAHDFNNLLVAICGFGEIARDNLPNGAGIAREAVEEILAAGAKAAELTRALLALSREQAFSRVPIDLNVAMAMLLKLVRRLIPERIAISFTPGPVDGQLLLDPVQLDRAVVNLCANAGDAISDTGNVQLLTDTVTLSAQELLAYPWASAGRFARIRVIDDGPGISESIREHIFEPFFTTKAEQGTGLGLATVYAIAKQHQGLVELDSTQGHGTCFSLFFPLEEGTSFPLPEARIAPPVVGGTETLLLAEDDPSVMRVMRGLLERNGYRVIHATDGTQALALFELHHQSIQIAVIDAVMPGITGSVLAQRMRSIHPSLPIVVVSGYTAGAFSEQLVKEHKLTLISKPFSSSALLGAIRQRLDEG
ncbi:MAG: response regulator [Polyangiaceae bacterium]|nr:response regulator [Polyangiaceae bacterium]